MKKLLVTTLAAALFIVACNKSDAPFIEPVPTKNPQEVGVTCANFIADSIRDHGEGITNDDLLGFVAQCVFECEEFTLPNDTLACAKARTTRLEERLAEAQAEVAAEEAAQSELGADPVIDETLINEEQVVVVE